MGDDDQNIYAFAGASVEFIRRFEQDYQAQTRFLVENYRSTANIIEIANAMGLETVAEGVENTAQFEHLCKLGCNSVQGWLISRAAPAQECIRWLEMHAQGRALPFLTQE